MATSEWVGPSEQQIQENLTSEWVGQGGVAVRATVQIQDNITSEWVGPGGVAVRATDTGHSGQLVGGAVRATSEWVGPGDVESMIG